MKVTLPWPHRDLSPNSRPHKYELARLKKSARDAAAWATVAQMSQKDRARIADGDGVVRMTITFCPPDRRRRDMDNMLASNKANLDGMADAIKIDDYRFEMTLRRGPVVKGGAVEVQFA